MQEGRPRSHLMWDFVSPNTAMSFCDVIPNRRVAAGEPAVHHRKPGHNLSHIPSCQAKSLAIPLTHSFQSQFSLALVLKPSLRPAKLDVYMPFSSPSRRALGSIENLGHNFLFLNILQISHFIPMICVDSLRCVWTNYNKVNNLRMLNKKNLWSYHWVRDPATLKP
jgi:hypothetical protein